MLSPTLFLLMVATAVVRCDENNSENYPHLNFVSCFTNKWSCVNKTVGISSTIDSITYECGFRRRSTTSTTTTTRSYYDSYGNYRQSPYSTTTTTKSPPTPENLVLLLSEWQNVQVRQLTVRDCDYIALNMNTLARSAIDSLVIENIGTLEIAGPVGEASYHPRYISFREIKNIPRLPTGMISNSDMIGFRISHAEIGLIERNAIKPDGKLKTFLWDYVDIHNRIKENAISVTMDTNSEFLINHAYFPVMKPLTLMIRSESPVIIQSSTFEMLQTAAITAAVPSFVFKDNEIKGASERMYVQSPEIIFESNIFRAWESPEKLLAWSIQNNNESTSQDVSFWFVDNYVNRGVKQPPAPEKKPPHDNIKCISTVKFLDRSQKCNEIRDQPGDEVYNLPSKKVSVLSVYICKNYAICEEAMKADCTYLIFNQNYSYPAWDPVRLMFTPNCQGSLSIKRNEVIVTDDGPNE